MKVEYLKIENLRKITNAKIEFNKPLILLYGDVQQGKSTFLDAIKILFSIGFPDDLIQHKKNEAKIELKLENGFISRSFYKNKKNEIVGRPLKAIVDNKPLSISEIKKKFNPFQLNQDFLKEMTGLERKKFFIELFGIDTIDIDANIKENENAAKDLRIEIKTFGEIDIAEVEKPDIENLLELKETEKLRLTNIYNEAILTNETRKSKWKVKCDKLRSDWKVDNLKHLSEIKDFNQIQKEVEKQILKINQVSQNVKDAMFNFIEETGLDVFDYDSVCVKIDNYNKAQTQPKKEKINSNLQDPTIPCEPEYLKRDFDKTKYNEILEKISDSKAEQVLFEAYEQRIEKNAQKAVKQVELLKKETVIRILRKEKISKLSEYGKEIENLAFDETGNLVYENIANDNLSTSQIVRLGSNLSKLFPKSLLNLELLDRAESLGKTIFKFVEKAEKEQTTILATIVGEKPANVPENIGVFVIENGELKS